MNDYQKAVKRLELSKCNRCGGTGKVDDADIGDIYCNVFTCSECNGTGFDTSANYPEGWRGE